MDGGSRDASSRSTCRGSGSRARCSRRTMASRTRRRGSTCAARPRERAQTLRRRRLRRSLPSRSNRESRGGMRCDSVVVAGSGGAKACSTSTSRTRQTRAMPGSRSEAHRPRRTEASVPEHSPLQCALFHTPRHIAAVEKQVVGAERCVTATVAATAAVADDCPKA